MGFKSACGAFLSPLRWSAERRTTTPVPSSKEGDYGAGKQILQGRRLGSLQALTPRERCCRFLIARPSGPLSRHRERGWGERADALRLPWERICAQYGFRFFVGEKSKSVSSTASDRGLGAKPQACFGSFYTSKRNAAAASRTNSVYYKTCPTEGDYKLLP